MYYVSGSLISFFTKVQSETKEDHCKHGNSLNFKCQRGEEELFPFKFTDWKRELNSYNDPALANLKLNRQDKTCDRQLLELNWIIVGPIFSLLCLLCISAANNGATTTNNNTAILLSNKIDEDYDSIESNLYMNLVPVPSVPPVYTTLRAHDYLVLEN